MIKYKDKELILSYYKDNEIKELIYTDNIIFGNVNLSEWEEYQIEQIGWTVDLNNQWQLATVRQDADTNFQTYQSFSNKGVNNGWARMKVNIAKGLSEFTLHFGSYAESNYDYTLVGNLDADMSTSTSTSTGTTSTTWKNASNNKQSANAPNITETYTIADTSREHFIWIAYRKDGSVNSYDDRGYVSFDKRLVFSFDGFRKKEYSYSAQTVSDYVYDFYLEEKWVYSEDKETIIKEDPLTATTEQLETRLIDGEETDTFQYGIYIYYKKYYQVKINKQWIDTDYYTFGEIKEEISFVEPDDYDFFVIYQTFSDNQTLTVANYNSDFYDILGNKVASDAKTYTFGTAGYYPMFLKQKQWHSNGVGSYLFHTINAPILGLYINSKKTYQHSQNALTYMFDNGNNIEYGKYIYIGESITYAGKTILTAFGRKVKEFVIPPQITAIHDWSFSIWPDINSSMDGSIYGCDKMYVWSDGTQDLTSVYSYKTQFGYTGKCMATNNPSTVKILYVPYGTSANWRTNTIFTNQYILEGKWTIEEMPEGATYENTHKRTAYEWYTEVMTKEKQ